MNNYAASLLRGKPKSREWVLAIVASVLIHIVALVLILACSNISYSKTKTPSFIDVDLMTLPAPKSKPVVTKKAAVKTSKKTVRKKAVKRSKKTVIPSKKKKSHKKFKKKVVRSEDVINNAIKRLERDLEKTKPDPISKRIKELEKETGKTSTQLKGSAPGKEESKGSATVLDRYRYNVGMAVWENWAFSEHLAGGKKHLETRIVFHVMPNGEIRDIKFTKRSGNSYMDSAASMAIVKSNPVRGHPPGVRVPFVEVRLSFTPEGLK